MVRFKSSPSDILFKNISGRYFLSLRGSWLSWFLNSLRIRRIKGRREEEEGGKGTPATKAASFASPPPTVLR